VRRYGRVCAVSRNGSDCRAWAGVDIGTRSSMQYQEQPSPTCLQPAQLRVHCVVEAYASRLGVLVVAWSCEINRTP
jgi:hypothetical protein